MAAFLKAPSDEGAIRATANTLPPNPQVGWYVLLAAILGSSMAFLDGSVVNLALPLLQADLHATAADAQWVMELYLLFLASFILLGGILGDHYGRRRIFVIGTTLFILASICCGFAPNLALLLLARAVQGLGGALLVPGSLAVISGAFSDQQREQAIGTWSAGIAIAAIVGPVTGGWLVQHASWRWAFFLNLPLAVIALAMALWKVPESRDEACQEKRDVWGTLLTVVGLGGVVFGLVEAGPLGFGHPLVLGALVGGIAALAAFLLVEAHLDAPLVPLSLFRSRSFSGANLLTFLLYAAFGGITFLLPFNLIQVQGYPPVAAGAVLMPYFLLMFLLSRRAERLTDRFGVRLPLVVGPLITGIGMALFAVPTVGSVYWVTFFPAVLVMGLGMALNTAPMTTLVMGAVEQRHAGIASAINNAVARIGGVLSIAVLGTIIISAFNSSLDAHLAHLPLSPGVRQMVDAQRPKLAGIQLPAGITGQLHAALKQAVDESFVSGFRVVALMCAGLALAGALCGWVMIEEKPSRRTNRAVTGESVEDEHELSASAIPGSLPGSQA
ncbi:MAG TPA: MFS transporter [Ktedonobacteraceae bacterium]